MKTRTNQPVFLDNGNPVDDSKLGGTKLYKHDIKIHSSLDEENYSYVHVILYSHNVATPLSSLNDLSDLWEESVSGRITYIDNNEDSFYGTLGISKIEYVETYGEQEVEVIYMSNLVGLEETSFSGAVIYTLFQTKYFTANVTPL